MAQYVAFRRRQRREHRIHGHARPPTDATTHERPRKVFADHRDSTIEVRAAGAAAARRIEFQQRQRLAPEVSTRCERVDSCRERDAGACEVAAPAQHESAYVRKPPHEPRIGRVQNLCVIDGYRDRVESSESRFRSVLLTDVRVDLGKMQERDALVLGRRIPRNRRRELGRTIRERTRSSGLPANHRDRGAAGARADLPRRRRRGLLSCLHHPERIDVVPVEREQPRVMIVQTHTSRRRDGRPERRTGQSTAARSTMRPRDAGGPRRLLERRDLHEDIRGERDVALSAPAVRPERYAEQLQRVDEAGWVVSSSCDECP